MNWLINRLGERTTWLGIFTMCSLVGIRLEPQFREVLIDAILAVAAVVAFVFRESHKERSTDVQCQTAKFPPIDLVGRSESVEVDDTKSKGVKDNALADVRVTATQDVVRMRSAQLPPDAHPQPAIRPVDDAWRDSWNG
jgi:hypothetical protein